MFRAKTKSDSVQKYFQYTSTKLSLPYKELKEKNGIQIYAVGIIL